MDWILENVNEIDTVATAVATLFSLLALPYITSKIKNAWLKKILALAVVVVREVYQTYVSYIKDARADGKLQPAEREEAQKMALEKLKSFFNVTVLSWFFGGKGNLDDVMKTAIEAGVNSVKKSSKASEVVQVAAPLPRT